MFDLGEVGVRVAIVHQRVQELSRIPDCFLPLVKSQVVRLFTHHIGDGLVGVILAVELSYAQCRGGVVVTEVLFSLPLLIAAFQKLIPIVEIFQRLRRKHCLSGHRHSVGPEPSQAEITLPVTYTRRGPALAT